MSKRASAVEGFQKKTECYTMFEISPDRCTFEPGFTDCIQRISGVPIEVMPCQVLCVGAMPARVAWKPFNN